MTARIPYARTRPFSYDPECEKLARHFLGDLASERLVQELSQELQQRVEDWLEYEKGQLEQEIARKPS